MVGDRRGPLEGVVRPMMDLSWYQGRRVLVTGHTGFKGSWLCRMLLLLGAEVTGYSLDAPTEPNLYSMAGLEGRIRDIREDVRDLEAMKQVFREAQPEVVLHLAAQPIVRTSYEQPVYTYETNVMGTVHLLECVRSTPDVRSVLNVTTDKVYLNREWAWGYREDEMLDGFDPYSNSKSCSELVTHSYVRSFFSAADSPRVSTARAGNVIGGGDFARDRIIPDCVRAAGEGRTIQVRNPHSTRPYQHVLEPLSAYLLIAMRQCEEPDAASWYNVGPDESSCVTTGELVDMFVRAWGGSLRWENLAEKNAPHEAGFLKLDCSKIRQKLGWKPAWDIRRALEETVKWSRVYFDGGDIPAEMDREIESYLMMGEE